MKKIFSLIFISFSFIFFAQENNIQKYSYDELKNLMEKNNPQLMSLQEEYYRSVLDEKDAKAGWQPTVDLQISGTFMDNPLTDPFYLDSDKIIDSIDWPAEIKPEKIGKTVKVFDGIDNTMYDFQLSVMQPVYTWGKIHNSIILYKKITALKLNQIESKRLELETELKTRLVSLCYLKNINIIIDEEKELAQRLVEISEVAEKTGILLHQDVVDAKLQAKELEIAQQDLNEQIYLQLLELSKSTGLEVLSLDEIDFAFEEENILSILQNDKDELLKRAISDSQISISSLNMLKEVHETAEKIAKGNVNWKPDFAIQLSFDYGGSKFPFIQSEWRDKDDYTFNISLGMKTTIWDGGKKVRDISRKISETKSAEINLEDVKSTLKKTFNEQWNAASVCTMKIEYQDLKIEADDYKIKQQETVFKTGYGSETDVLSAKITRCNDMIEKEQQKLNRAIACLTLQYICNN